MQHIPLEDFFRNSQQTAFQISPDGSHISFLAPYRDRMNLYVCPVEAIGGSVPLMAAARRITAETERSLAGYMWADDARLLFLRDDGGNENYHLFGVNADGSDLRCYTPFPDVRVSIIDDLEDVPHQVLIGMNRRNPEAFDPYRLDLRTGELTLLAENPGNYQGWVTDHDGCLRAVTAIVDGVNTQLLYRDTEDEAFRPVLTTNFREQVGFLLFTPDNRHVYAASNLGRDKTALVLMDPATATELNVLYEHPQYDISNISYSRRRRKLLGVFCSGHREPVRHYFDAHEEAFMTHLRSFFPGRRCGVADTDKSENCHLLYVGGDRTRGAYYYYNKEEDRPRLIAELAPWLSEASLVPMTPFKYTARDGLEIEAYLSLPCTPPPPPSGEDGQSGSSTSALPVLPKGADPLPLVVIPHGGPWARDHWGYDSEVQFLCNRGYAVLQMNFRGSTGYGRRFLELSYKQWGLSMQDDITDGVLHLIRQGIANPSRVAIYGASYGGYAALAGLCFTPELYCCGVDYCGVSNLFTFMQTIPPYWRPMLEMMHQQVGDPETDREQFTATSPALHADSIRVPLFIAQGANDPRVNQAESDQMVNALLRRGIEVEYLVCPDEGHGFANQENRFRFYRQMEQFLARHL